LFGARTSLALSFASTLGSVVIGVTLGLLAALHGGWTGALIMRLVDAQLAFPFIVLAIATVAAIGTSLLNLFVLLVVFGWAQFARVVRGETLGVMQTGYVEAARATGLTEWRIATHYILPNVATPVIVIAAYTVPQIIIIESALSFLGVGVQPPTPSWGSMLSEGQTYLDSAWWLATSAGVAITVTVLAINIVGSALRDANDPRRRS
jgi:peptide/nickel transport system permease protein